ncbi:unnamed protein product [Trypanosoma congolense IL3000]|uniref:WGS project CAEQ00000000 data, annotated contig 1353 n=1 Tax=Trypanosoma congolense (strain IL3000) TaxID=1068625 RepID=F9W5P3_TRYCI|nr:unnamed protein product [Trypanosoma congolense IL3000]
MFSVEFVSGRPRGSPSYYAIVVRTPYLLGRSSHCDITLDDPEIADQHASLTVMRWSKAKAFLQGHQTGVTNSHTLSDGDSFHLIAGAKNAPRSDSTSHDYAAEPISSLVDGTFLNDTNNCRRGANDSPADDSPEAFALGRCGARRCRNISSVQEEDPLVVCVKKQCIGGRVAVGCVEAEDTHTLILKDGEELALSSRLRLRLRFRPLVVSVSRIGFSAERVRELEDAFVYSGATITRLLGPTRELDLPLPVGKLHCTAVLSYNDPMCIAALACGYSIVDPAYIGKWFAALARCAAAPLPALPPPACSSVAIRFEDSSLAAVRYLRPECDEYPFPLYPVPSQARVDRSREKLFDGRTFFFLTNSVENRYRAAVLVCGGRVQHMEDVAITISALRADASVGRVCKDLPAGVLSEFSTPKMPCYYAVLGLDTEVAWRKGDSLALSALRNLSNDAYQAGYRIVLLAERGLFQSLLTNRFTVIEVVLPTFGVSNCDGKRVLSGTPPPRTTLPTPGEEGAATGGVVMVKSDVTGELGTKKFLALMRKQFDRGLCTPRRRRKSNCVHGDAGGTFSIDGRVPSTASQCSLLCHRVKGLVKKEKVRLLEVVAASRRNLFVDPGNLEYALRCREASTNYVTRAQNLLVRASKKPRIRTALTNCIDNCRAILDIVQKIVDFANTGSRGRKAGENRRLSLSNRLGYVTGTTSSTPVRVPASNSTASAVTTAAVSVAGTLPATPATKHQTPVRNRWEPVRVVDSSPRGAGTGGSGTALTGRQPPHKIGTYPPSGRLPDACAPDFGVLNAAPAGRCQPLRIVSPKSLSRSYEPDSVGRERYLSRGVSPLSTSKPLRPSFSSQTNFLSGGGSRAQPGVSSPPLWPSAPRSVPSPRVSRVTYGVKRFVELDRE